MADKYYYIGSTGPFIYDDADTYDDGYGHVALKTGEQILVGIAPSLDNNVVRKVDVGTIYAPAYATYLVLSLDGTLTDERALVAGDLLTLTDGGAGGNATLDVDYKDEDNMASDSDVHVPTQQSVKAYVDDAVTNIVTGDGTTGGSGSAGTGNQYVEITVNGTTYKVLHDGTV